MTEFHSPALDPRQPFAAGPPMTEPMIHRLVHGFIDRSRLIGRNLQLGLQIAAGGPGAGAAGEAVRS